MGKTGLMLIWVWDGKEETFYQTLSFFSLERERDTEKTFKSYSAVEKMSDVIVRSKIEISFGKKKTTKNHRFREN